MHIVAPTAPKNSHQIIFLLTPPLNGMVLLTPGSLCINSQSNFHYEILYRSQSLLYLFESIPFMSVETYAPGTFKLYACVMDMLLNSGWSLI
jgi:hypothetical protein